MLKEIIAVANDKGGVGKTTTAQALALGLRNRRHKVLIIDGDAQCNISLTNGWKSEWEEGGARTLYDALRSESSSLPVYRCENRLYLCPASRKLTGVSSALSQQLSPNTVLRDILERPLAQSQDDGFRTIADFDYVIIDCPPNLGPVTTNAMAAATGIIIPVLLESYAVVGLAHIITKWMEVRKKLNPNLEMKGILFTNVNSRLTSTKELRENIRSTFDFVFDTEIRKTVRIPECQGGGGDIYTYDPKGKGAEDYREFVKEFLSKSSK